MVGAYREKIWRERDRDRDRERERTLEQREIAAWEKKKERQNDGTKKEIKRQSRLLCFFSHSYIPKDRKSVV